MGIVATVALVVLSRVSKGFGSGFLVLASAAVMYSVGHPSDGFWFFLIVVCLLIVVSIIFGVLALLVLCGLKVRRHTEES